MRTSVAVMSHMRSKGGQNMPPSVQLGRGVAHKLHDNAPNTALPASARR